ncbi:hypothetical protein [Aeromicrobium sp. UC242_57]
MVANAANLGTHEVSFRGRTWTSTASHEGWRKDPDAVKTAVVVSTN